MGEKRVSNLVKNLVEDELPEMTQEEAIKRYKEDDTIETKRNFSEDDANSEESEHLKRIKKELLASLERVKQLAKRIYGEDKSKTKTKTKQEGGKKKEEKTQEKESKIEDKEQEKGRDRE